MTAIHEEDICDPDINVTDEKDYTPNQNILRYSILPWVISRSIVQYC